MFRKPFFTTCRQSEPGNPHPGRGCRLARQDEQTGSAFLLFTLIFSCVLVGLVSSMPMADVSAQQSADLLQNLHLSAQLVSANLSSTLQSPGSWAATIADPLNVNMNCFQPGNSCAAFTATYPVQNLYDESGNLIYSSNTRNGFDQAGRPCPAQDNWNCPFQINLTWSALCTTNPCTGILNGTLVLSSTNPLVLKTINYPISASH